MRKRILIVDDQRDLATLMHHYLGNEKYEIEEVYSGAEALTRVFVGNFDLVIMDYAMKDIKGDRICALMRADDKTKNIPVLFVTGHAEIDEKVFHDYGVTEVFYKPISGDILREAVKKHLSN